MSTLKIVASSLVLLALCIAAGYGVIWLVGTTWTGITNADDKIAVAIVAGFFSIIGAAVTVTLGRHYDRKKDIEAAFRERKIEIYDKFLIELFKTLHGKATEEQKDESEDLVHFLQDWQRTLVLWGGKDVLKAYISWMKHLKKGDPDAKTLYLTDEFFRALRKDIGQSSFGIEKGNFSHLWLRHADLALSEAKRNPKIKLSEIAELEKKLGLEG